MHFLEKLDAVTGAHDSLVCVGLDTDPAKIPAHLRSQADGVLHFNRALVEATADIVQSYKLNLAFYESMGRSGYDVLRGTLDAIPAEVLTIGDAKRGDIGNTAAMYAQALFDDLGFDAATVAPYMGYDSVEPFLRHAERGVFVLALTSNRGSQDFQYLQVDGQPVYKHVIRSAMEWNEHRNLGFVVGATHPFELEEIRGMVDDLPLLIPGLGAQGGDVALSVRAGIAATGGRAVFNSSRGIIYAGSGEDFAVLARQAAEELRTQINQYRVAE
ncbi:MAG: orotidine-5'-phosphate decarboxylase [Bacteroidetes bacterium]|nr:orotidine-5'-phosphate decarboxylase [Bacteroidota bacterium]